MLNIDDPFYPQSALSQRKEGVCGVHLLISAEGEVEEVKVTESAGSTELDQASLDAIYAASVVPALMDAKAVAASNDAWVLWVLPN